MKLHELLARKRELADDMLNGAGDIAPTEFDIADVAPDREEVLFADVVTLDDVLQNAENNHVELYDQSRLAQLLTDHPVRLTEIERFLLPPMIPPAR